MKAKSLILSMGFVVVNLCQSAFGANFDFLGGSDPKGAGFIISHGEKSDTYYFRLALRGSQDGPTEVLALPVAMNSLRDSVDHIFVIWKDDYIDSLGAKSKLVPVMDTKEAETVYGLLASKTGFIRSSMDKQLSEFGEIRQAILLDSNDRKARIRESIAVNDRMVH